MPIQETDITLKRDLKMVNISSLLNMLPISNLEPNWIGIIRGFSEKLLESEEWRETDIWFIEPPAGQHVPFVDPVETMALLFAHQGMGPEEAAAEAAAEYEELRLRLGDAERVRFYNYSELDSPECIPAPVLIAYLRAKRLVAECVTDFLDHAVSVAVATPIFQGPDNWNDPWPLSELPDVPPPRAMIEFYPGPPWDENAEEERYSERFEEWRRIIRPVAEELEKTLGEPVYYFADLDDELDDDNGHRFLVLHWVCTFKPDSLFVRFLVETTHSQDVDELKCALIEPENYVHQHKMYNAFIGLETSGWPTFEYIPSVAG
jgi:hypothetical protein